MHVHTVICQKAVHCEQLGEGFADYSEGGVHVFPSRTCQQLQLVRRRHNKMTPATLLYSDVTHDEIRRQLVDFQLKTQVPWHSWPLTLPKLVSHPDLHEHVNDNRIDA